MKRLFSAILTLSIILTLLSCEDEGATAGGEVDLGGDDTVYGDTPLGELGAYDGYFDGEAAEYEIKCISGSADCYTVEGSTVTFSGIGADSVYSISGRLSGNIVIDAGEHKLELEMCGLSLVSREISPITVLGGDEVTLTAKKETKNYIYDMRAAIDETDETAKSGAIHSECDLEIKGKGTLSVVSESNNGIHTKDDLQVKNLTLDVVCRDNALKGNDSVELSEASVTLIARGGDGIKTKNTDISEKGNQRGDLTVSGSMLTVYAACDGLDAAHDVIIDTDTTVLKIYTNRYSTYTDSSLILTEDEEEDITSMPDWDFDLGFGFTRPGGGHGGKPGGGMGGGAGGGMGGMGGMDGGNTEKPDYSAKGIKAGNLIMIRGGSVTVKSVDDAIHANGGETMENGETGLGGVDVGGGALVLYSNDDGIHADGALSVRGGSITVEHSYEALEGETVEISGGGISLCSNDDGINSTAAIGVGITLSGGEVSLRAGGDGIDANTSSMYEGIVFSGARVTVISTSGGNSAIDTERGYSFSSGSVLAIMPSGGMSGEATHTLDFSSVGTAVSLSVSAGETVAVSAGDLTHEAQVPTDMRATVIYLGASDAIITVK